MNETIYFIQEDYNGPVKIGTTSLPVEQRLVGLQVGNPRTLHLIGRFLVDIKNAERKVHDSLKDFCIRGEWYQAKAARNLLKLWRDTGTWTYKRDTVPVREIKDKVNITTTEEQAAWEEYNRPEVKAIWDAISKAFK